MTGYQPVHLISGLRGPVMEFATQAALWIAHQPDVFNWRWDPVDKPAGVSAPGNRVERFAAANNLPMKTQTLTETLFSAAEVAKAANVAEHELRHFEPEGFGSPGHYRMNGTGGVVYTPAGVDALARGFDAVEKPLAAHSLRVLLKERTAVPHSAPALRKPPGEPWFKTGTME